MEIKKNIEKIPGGMMVVPLVLGAIIHSIWPKADVLLTGVTGLIHGRNISYLVHLLLCRWHEY